MWNETHPETITKRKDLARMNSSITVSGKKIKVGEKARDPMPKISHNFAVVVFETPELAEEAMVGFDPQSTQTGINRFKSEGRQVRAEPLDDVWEILIPTSAEHGLQSTRTTEHGESSSSRTDQPWQP